MASPKITFYISAPHIQRAVMDALAKLLKHFDIPGKKITCDAHRVRVHATNLDMKMRCYITGAVDAIVGINLAPV
jgi:hypothetical protein